MDQSPLALEGGNPFELVNNLSRKRGVEETSIGQHDAQAAVASAVPQGIMPLPKRRLTDASVPTAAAFGPDGTFVDPNGVAAMQRPGPDGQAFHAFDSLPHSPQHSLNLYSNTNGVNGNGNGVGNEQSYFSGTIAVGNSENGQIDPNAKHVLRHLHMPSYNGSNASSALNSPSTHSIFTSTTDADAQSSYMFDHDSPDMMRDEDTSVGGVDPAYFAHAAGMSSNAGSMASSFMVDPTSQQQQQQQRPFGMQNGGGFGFGSAQAQQEMAMQPMQQQQQQEMQMQQQMQPNHPLAPMANAGMFTTQNPVQAAYDSYNGGFLDDDYDSMAGRYTGDGYAARLEGVMGHA